MRISDWSSDLLVTRKLTDYARGLYAARTYCSEYGAPESIPALQRHPLVGYIDEMIYAPQLRYMDEIAPGLSPEFRSSSINAQYHMISTSTGIGVLPCFIGDSSKELVRIDRKSNRLNSSH